MKPENAIEVHDIKKRFKVYFDKGSSLKEKILFKNRNRYEERWVLNGVSFEVKKGEAIGLIGKNGCGKSTTLKMLSRIMYPTKGSIEIQGRVSSLIELGAGFHPDMSGRENIFTNASIFGLNHAEIEKRLDDIIKFSELEEFIDNPVRTYSSGMYMRLAFAVAINVDADILLIDEILAVGDVSFQAKCFEKLKEIKAKGTTIVIVSHVMGQIQQICDRAIWLEEGLIKEEGTPKVIGEHYLEIMEERRMEKLESDYQKEREEIEKEKAEKEKEKEKNKEELEKKKIEEQKIKEKEEKLKEAKLKEAKKKEEREIPSFCRKGATRKGNGKIEFTDAAIINGEGKETILFEVGEPLKINMKYKSTLIDQSMSFVVSITRDDGVYCFGTGALAGVKEKGVTILAKEEGEATFFIETNNLLQGHYLIDIGIQTGNEIIYDYIYSALELRIVDKKKLNVGIVQLPGYWDVDGQIIKAR